MTEAAGFDPCASLRIADRWPQSRHEAPARSSPSAPARSSATRISPPIARPAFRSPGSTIRTGQRPQTLAGSMGRDRPSRSVEEAAAVEDAIFDLATPPAAHADDPAGACPDGASALIQKPMGSDLAEATEILEICRAQQAEGGGEFPAALRADDAGAQGCDRQGLARRGRRFRRLAGAGDAVAALGIPAQGRRASRSPCIRSTIST